MELLSPVWPAASTPRPVKQRPATLSGIRVALVDDNLDIPFTTHLETLLTERNGAKVRRLVKPARRRRRRRSSTTPPAATWPWSA